MANDKVLIFAPAIHSCIVMLSKGFKVLSQPIYQVVLLSALVMALLFIAGNVFVQRTEGIVALLNNFLVIFGYVIVLWAANFAADRIFLKQHYILRSTVHFLLTSILAIGLLMILSKFVLILPGAQVPKTIAYGFRGFFTNLLIYAFRLHTALLLRYRETATEKARQALEFQLTQLKIQLNPHFLFNSLNTLKAMVENNDARSSELIVRLAEVYRYFLDNTDTNLREVGKELEFARAYFFMLERRFEGSLHFEVVVPDNVLFKKIPTHTLQILIENAVKHNVISPSSPLTIKIFLDEKYLVVQNKLQPKRHTPESTQIGLKNLEQRCILLLGQPLLTFTSDQSFFVKIPVI